MNEEIKEWRLQSVKHKVGGVHDGRSDFRYTEESGSAFLYDDVRTLSVPDELLWC